MVTGGSRGLGRGIALVLAEAGADVVITYRHDARSARETADAVGRIGRRALAFQADVSDINAMARVVEEANTRLGTIDLCVSNAGVPSPGTAVADTDPADFRGVVEVHLIGAFNCARAVLPGMRRLGRGDLIFISSEVTAKYPSGRGPYTAAKAGIEALARTVALEERTNGIRANCIAPGVVNTGYAEKAARRRGFTSVAELAMAMPFGRLATPEEIGKLCVFLASNGSYITGEVIYVNGGG